MVPGKDSPSTSPSSGQSWRAGEERLYLVSSRVSKINRERANFLLRPIVKGLLLDARTEKEPSPLSLAAGCQDVLVPRKSSPDELDRETWNRVYLEAHLANLMEEASQSQNFPISRGKRGEAKQASKLL